MTPKVIIVSNRLPISVKKVRGELTFSFSIGGLATGLASYVSNKRNNVWIGWPGIPSDDLTSKEKQIITDRLSRQGYIPVWLSEKQIDAFYNGYSNSVIWPLFHGLSFSATNDNLMETWWKAYKSVNRRYSDAVLSVISAQSQVWVHDYHLMLLPELIRAEQTLPHIGFFLHIPFPEPKLLKSLPQYKEIVNGILGSDLIGFHTTSYRDNFLSTVKDYGLGEVNKDQIVKLGRRIRVANFPMGIDYNKFANSSNLTGVKALVKEYKRKYRRQRIIASVDRLDPSKGLIERLEAYSTYLERNPSSASKVVFVMVAAPSRTDISDYKKLSNELKTLVTKINKRFGNSGWTPIDYINEPVPFEHVTALFQIADIAFITPLKDGMNLAAKEFVASNKKNGVLILSSSAGAAEELTGAIIVNPNRPEELVNALELALSMKKRELKRRLKNMREYLSNNTVQDWAKSFIDALNQPVPGTPSLTYTLNDRLSRKLISQYKSSERRLLMLDYDGSLSPYTSDFSNAKPSKDLVSLLASLAKDPANEVVVISGRRASELEKWFGKLNINLVAEHGAAIKLLGGTGWENTIELDNDWQNLLLPTLEKYARLTPGALVEIKPNSLVWHYRSASTYHAQKYSVVLKRSLKPILKRYGLVLMQGNKILEIKHPAINKGSAVKRWVVSPHDFILAIGDDTTDEDLFRILPESAFSIKVGKGLTYAQYRLPTTKHVVRLLKKLVR